MAVFVDTSALYALLYALDANHLAAGKHWAGLAERTEILITSNYVLVETAALLQRRVGLQAVRDLQVGFVPLFRVHWVDEDLHVRASAALLTAGRRDLSLVDCVSFEVMRALSLDTAFAFDEHFTLQGFRCMPRTALASLFSLLTSWSFVALRGPVLPASGAVCATWGW